MTAILVLTSDGVKYSRTLIVRVRELVYAWGGVILTDEICNYLLLLFISIIDSIKYDIPVFSFPYPIRSRYKRQKAPYSLTQLHMEPEVQCCIHKGSTRP